MSFDAVTVRKELGISVDGLVWEVETLWRLLEDNDFYSDNRHWPTAHYGYMMACFARIDLLSRYWEGTKKDQTKRMERFMLRYMYPGKATEAAIAIQMWRHGLMHTAEPRIILVTDTKTSTKTKVAHLLHFGDWLKRDEHFILVENGNDRILQMSVTFFATDLRDALGRYLDDLEGSEELQGNYLHADRAIRTQTLSI